MDNKKDIYCKLCNFGTYSKDTMDIHNNTDKDKKYVIRQNKK